MIKLKKQISTTVKDMKPGQVGRISCNGILDGTIVLCCWLAGKEVVTLAPTTECKEEQYSGFWDKSYEVEILEGTIELEVSK
jgi:hypothetical protein